MRSLGCYVVQKVDNNAVEALLTKLEAKLKIGDLLQKSGNSRFRNCFRPNVSDKIHDMA
jgi:6-phosphogluconate dehydrogenase (decarboxylating)